MKQGLMLALKLPFSQQATLREIISGDFLLVAVLLQVFRWMSTSFITVSNLYLQNTPMLQAPPFGLSAREYRFYEIFGYGPYGLVIVTCLGIWFFMLVNYRSKQKVSFKTCLTVVGFSCFTPWLPALVIDNILIANNMAGPEVIVPWHISIILLENWLLYQAAHVVFGVPKRQALFMIVVSMALFLELAAALIR
ncbi:MAG: hypothetical protein HQL54_09815 [Magnetococcales bacterium]|nr:hypothetical protein [Magnetococcales bacterium]